MRKTSPHPFSCCASAACLLHKCYVISQQQESETAAFMQALGKVHLQPEFANEKLLIHNVSYFVDLAKNTIVCNTQRKPKQVSTEEICKTIFNHYKLKKMPTLTICIYNSSSNKWLSVCLLCLDFLPKLFKKNVYLINMLIHQHWFFMWGKTSVMTNCQTIQFQYPKLKVPILGSKIAFVVV